MKYDMVEEMKKSITTGELGKSKSLLVNSLLWDESEEIVEALEALAEENSIFVQDNKEILEKKKDENQGEYIDRINTEIKLNFSKEKYLILKEEFKKYHLKQTNNNISEITFITSKDESEGKNKVENKIYYDRNKMLLVAASVVAGALVLASVIGRNKRKKR